MKTLCVDIGTHTGYSVWQDGVLEASGTLHLADAKELDEARKAGAERRRDIRCDRLFTQLQFICPAPDRVVFEDVQFASTTMQAHLWASLRAAVWFAFPGAEFQCVPVASLKVFATGDGKAQKEDMLGVLEEVAPALDLPCNLAAMDDNECDAIWLGLYNIAVTLGEVDYHSVYENKRAKAKERKLKLKAKQAAQALAEAA